MSAPPDDNVDGWQDHERRDGARVEAIPNLGIWIAAVAGRPVLTMCPCCDKTFSTARAAKLVCNALYPMASA
jgi:hypothetical protein